MNITPGAPYRMLRKLQYILHSLRGVEMSPGYRARTQPRHLYITSRELAVELLVQQVACSSELRAQSLLSEPPEARLECVTILA